MNHTPHLYFLSLILERTKPQSAFSANIPIKATQIDDWLCDTYGLEELQVSFDASQGIKSTGAARLSVWKYPQYLGKVVEMFYDQARTRDREIVVFCVSFGLCVSIGKLFGYF